LDNKVIFVCEDSIDGIFTAIYKAWSSGYGHANVKIEARCDKCGYSNYELFSEYRTVETDYTLAMKVSRAIISKISQEAYELVCRVALSFQEGKADLIYRFLILGFLAGAEVVNHLSNEVVNKVFRISRNVNNEAHHYLGFVRFSEHGSGLLTSIIQPKNNILSIIAPHFADRLPGERFVIYDSERKNAVLHVPGKPWIITDFNGLDDFDLHGISCVEDEYRQLWSTFFKHIAIKERVNPKLQRNNLPLRYRRNMTEFLIGKQ
jgi:probable DNA metabolism protein